MDDYRIGILHPSERLDYRIGQKQSMIVIVARVLLQWDSSKQNNSNEADLKSLSSYSFLLVV